VPRRLRIRHGSRSNVRCGKPTPCWPEERKPRKLYEQALGTWRELGDRYKEAQTLYLTGRVHARISRPANALEWYERALAIFRDLRDLTAQNIVLNNLGIAYNNLSRSADAVGVLQQAVEIGKALDDPIDQALPLNNLGIAYNHALAIRLFEAPIPPA
jgi:tetratricopeptide (TPR) repeat protein